jgi:hypothetical protein
MMYIGFVKGNGLMNRWIIITGLSIVLAGLIVYGAAQNPWVTLNDALARPDQYDGRLINLFIYPKVERLTTNGFDIREVDGPMIHVLGDTAGLKVGEFVGMQAIFHKEGYLVATHAEISKRRKYKVIFSLLPVVLVGFLFIRSFQFNIRKGQIEVRDA